MWRRGEGEGKEYRERKRKYKILCKMKKEEGRNRLIEEAREGGGEIGDGCMENNKQRERKEKRNKSRNKHG